ncbi:putative entry exclusion protein TrbK-alt [Mesorhizobium sp. B2-4-17]|uniref:putative entry exclusion protein TrbK-alt n=1 Tax=Mesorhizobium sp. B2-4-17 TaxID=2589932 RepID=UPI001129D111|nr:putative entry exclusion protein TrbK-alt [Mesorhizobium sp. B2-4-17]TPK84560.1 conjugal transfer protein TrbK [Mesorhizobium sp. B2-4-17]
MDGKTFARIVALVFVAVVVTATALEMTRKEESQVGNAAAVPAPSTPDPVRESLRHCQGLGEAALRDDECLRLWAQQRERFLGFKAPSGSSTSEPPAPQSQDATRPEAR